MKLFLKIAGSCVVGGVLLLAWTLWRGTGIRYTERITGIDLPSSHEGYQSESCDFAQVSFMRLSPTQVRELLDSTEFTDPTESNSQRNAVILFDQLGIGDQIPEMPELGMHSGGSKRNRWQFFLHEATGRLWMIVFYSDMAGDLPVGGTE